MSKAKANAELMKAAGTTSGKRGVTAVSQHIGATQGHKARMSALTAMLDAARPGRKK